MTHHRPVLETLEGKLLLSHVHASHVHALVHSAQVMTLAAPPVFAPVKAMPAITTLPAVVAPTTVTVLSASDAHPAVWQYPITPTIYLVGNDPLYPTPRPGTQTCLAELGGSAEFLTITVPTPRPLPQT